VERLDKWFTSAYMGGSEDSYFAISHAGPKGGDPARWDYLSGPLEDADMAELANYEELTEYLDIGVFSDYLLVHWYAGVRDWPDNNWWGGNRNVPDAPFQFFSWDGEWSFGVGQGSPDEPQVHPDFVAGAGSGSGPESARIFNSAKASPEFMIALADRAYRAFYNDGALRDEHARARWQALADHLETPVVAESARWGDAVTGGPTRTRDMDWQDEVDFQDAYMDGGAATMISALRAEGYYPAVDPPLFFEGAELIEITAMELDVGLPLETHIELDGGAGILYYTIDGTDPRAVGGTAQGTEGGVEVDVELVSPMLLQARTLDGNEWSALHVLDVQPSVPDDGGGSSGDGGESEGEGEGGVDETQGAGTSGGEGTGAGSASGDTSATADSQGEAESGGCGCRSGPRSTPPLLLLLGLGGVVRRRRPRRSSTVHGIPPKVS